MARLTPTALVSVYSKDCNHQHPAAALHLQAHAPCDTLYCAHTAPTPCLADIPWEASPAARSPWAGRESWSCTPSKGMLGWRRGDGLGGCAGPALKQLRVFRWHLPALISVDFPPPGTTSPNHTQIFNKMTAGCVPGREGTRGCCTKALCVPAAPLDTLK